MEKYEPQKIEPKWQKRWEENAAYSAADTEGDNFYCLDMFPYPSGAGLHVGHPEGYTATDIFSRFQRMHGKNVLHPMGWDAFGLPAENYAIKTGVHPDESTHKNIENFTRQVKSLGFSYDWSREVDTSSPQYYRWTQWLFLQMYNNGLAERKKAKVNWCDTCQTVLANEQVVDGKCERSKDEVVQKDMEQWFFKTTKYAEQLLSDLDTIDWPEPVKLMQRNWIGKSEGAEIDFAVDGHDGVSIRVFTTRPDTLFGATYMVLAPEHALVEQITTPEQKEAVAAYQEVAAKKNDLERTDLAKEKTGVFTGAYAVNPANDEKIPVWIADYVLATYGTGAIMAVPAHDERDQEFAEAFDLPIVSVVTEDGAMHSSGEFDGMDSEEAKQAITEKVGGEMKTTYRLRDWLVSRQRYWGAPIPIVYDPEGNPHPVKEEHLPLELPTDVDYNPKGTSPLGSSEAYVQRAEELYGEGWRFEIDTLDTFVCSSWYYLRYCDPQNEDEFASAEALKRWLPVNMYVGGMEHAVLHLLYARFVHKALLSMGHIPEEVGSEPFAALRNQGMILAEDGQKMSKSLGNVVNPDDVIEEYGADTMRLYEMFMGPFADAKPWSTDSIKGVRRFLERVWNLFQHASESGFTSEGPEEIEREMHKTIKKVTEDIEGFNFNTAISQMMIFVNTVYGADKQFTQQQAQQFLQLLYPYAPHITEELAEQIGVSQELFSSWPTYDEAMIVEDTVTIAVQINGKVRGKIELAADATEEDALQATQQEKSVTKHIEGKETVKVIYIPGKILNIVVK